MSVPHAPGVLESRLRSLGSALLADPDGLGLLALGSVGAELARLDAWSDLDFFAIVRAEAKPRFLSDLSWLDRASPLAWSFANTADGRKVLWEDGIYGEYAVFSPEELASAAFAEGRWIARRPELPEGLRKPANPAGRTRPRDDAAWCAAELASCLYVGLCRFRRGERLSAWRFVQTFCLDRWQELVELLEPATEVLADPYGRDRRFEQRWPAAAAWLPRLIRGYDDTQAVALAFLEWIESRGLAPAPLAAEIRALAEIP